VLPQGDPPLLRDWMSQPVHTIAPDATLNEAAARMLALRIRHLVVVNDAGEFQGVLNEHDLTRTMALAVMDGVIEDERRLQQAVLRAIPDLVWLKDTQGVYLSCNPRFEAFYGATERDIVGRTDFDFVDPSRPSSSAPTTVPRWPATGRAATRSGSPSPTATASCCRPARSPCATPRAGSRACWASGGTSPRCARPSRSSATSSTTTRRPCSSTRWTTWGAAQQPGLPGPAGLQRGQARRMQLPDFVVPGERQAMRERVTALGDSISESNWHCLRPMAA
jgi:hypothetical protein